jgi:hypothetical protein
VVAAVTKAAPRGGKAGTYDLVGPSEFALTEIVELINGRPAPVERMPDLEVANLPGPPRTVVDLLAKPSSPSDPEVVARIFGLFPTPPETTWPIVSATGVQ